MDEQTTVVAFVNNLPFFSIFSEEEKADISQLNSHLITFRAQERIINEGEIDSALYILLKGAVYISKNSHPQIQLGKLKPGDVFGEIAFVKNSARSTNATAETEVLVIKISDGVFEKLNPEIQNKFRIKFMDILVARLDSLNRRYIRDIHPK